MNKEFIPYEQALELKELGFNEPCLSSWMENDYIVQYQKRHKEDDTYLPAPLYQQAFRWFRDKYDLHYQIEYMDEVLQYGYVITEISTNTELEEKYKFTYEGDSI